jgi:hypothetical protein
MVDAGNLKHELLNRLWSILAVNVLTCLCVGFMQLMSVRLQAFSGLLWADCYSSWILSAPKRTGPNQDDSVSFIYLLSVSMTFSDISTLLY